MEHDTGAPAFGPGREPAAAQVPGADVVGVDAPARPGRSRRALSIGGAALVLVVAGGAAAWAATSPSPSPSRTSPGPGSSAAPSPGGEGRELRDLPGGLGRRGALGPRGAVHGSLTVPDGSGGYRQVLVQRGTVTVVSSTSLSVHSDDGFTATYRLTDQTRYDGAATSAAGLRTGQAVAVVAGGDSAALQVRDVLPGAMGRHGHRGLLGPDGSGPDASEAPDGPDDPSEHATPGQSTSPAAPSGRLPGAPGAGAPAGGYGV